MHVAIDEVGWDKVYYNNYSSVHVGVFVLTYIHVSLICGVIVWLQLLPHNTCTVHQRAQLYTQ